MFKRPQKKALNATKHINYFIRNYLKLHYKLRRDRYFSSGKFRKMRMKKKNHEFQFKMLTFFVSLLI